MDKIREALEERIGLWRAKYLPRLNGPSEREDLLYIIAMDAIAAIPEPAPVASDARETRSDIIGECLNELERLTGEDLHGYRSEVWRVVARAYDHERAAIKESMG